MDADYEIMKEAAINRRRCPECLKVFSAVKPETQCQCVDPSLWIQRWDDSSEMYYKRYQTFVDLVIPVIEQICHEDTYVKLNIFKQKNIDFKFIQENLEQYLPQ